MRYFLAVRRVQFYVSATLDRGSPFCLSWEGTILDCDDLAAQKGVRLGMTLRQAQALLANGDFRIWKEEAYAQAQFAWLDELLPFSSVIEPEEQHRAFVDLSLHPDPRSIAREILGRFGETAALGAGPSKWLARLSSELAPGGSLFDHAASDPADFLAPLPLERLSPLLPEEIERLKFLGYRRVRELAALPASVLEAQFGKGALRMRQASIGRLSEPVRPLYPPDRLELTFRPEGGAENWLAIESALALLGKRLGKALAQREAQTFELVLTLRTRAGERRFARTFRKAIASPLGAVSALRLLLREEDLRKDIDDDFLVEAMRVQALELTRADRRQRDLYGQTPTKERDESAQMAIAAIRGKFGESAVIAGTQAVLPRRAKVLRAWREATGWR